MFCLTGNFVGHYPCFPYFPCAVGTLLDVCFGDLKMELFLRTSLVKKRIHIEGILYTLHSHIMV